jgi:hypothetical protein
MQHRGLAGGGMPEENGVPSVPAAEAACYYGDRTEQRTAAGCVPR